MQRALITGIGGFVGGYLAAHLLEQEYEVWGVVRRLPTEGAELDSRVRLIPADLNDPAAIQRAVAEARPDLVFHLAAQANVPQSWKDPEGTYVTNVLGQLHLLEALLAEAPGAAVLIASSNEVYGKPQPEDLPVRETAPLRPQNPYGVSKVAQDMMGYQYFVGRKLGCVRVRAFNHIGPRQTDAYVAAAFARQIAEAEAGLQPPVVRVGELTAQRDFSDVRDIVRGYLLALTKGEPGEVYNLGSGRAVSARQILDFLLERALTPISVEIDPARLRPVDTPLVVCDATKIRERTGWAPAIPLEQTLEEVLAYWRQRVRTGENKKL
ncbi:MAG: GDP-mannose 4,6-dehydratase [Chloroflexi bacterium]|nr:GDP-mannose 4,6-dehydratase [Chloroflexota bacterium]